MNATNPYAAHRSADLDPSSSQASSIFLTLIGIVFSSLATLGASIRLVQVMCSESSCWLDVTHKLNTIAPLMGLGVFAVAAFVLQTYYVQVKWLPIAEQRMSQLFLVIATTAMLARTLFEPDTLWTPDWPSYSLTSSAVVAMGMVWLRSRDADGKH